MGKPIRVLLIEDNPGDTRLIREMLTEAGAASFDLARADRLSIDEGYWRSVEAYVSEHSDVEFSHDICPACMKKLYPWYHAEKE